MRTAYELLLGLFLINLAVGIVSVLQLPGTTYVVAAPSSVNGTQYEQQFNASSIYHSWSATPFSGIPVIGDIFGGLTFLYNNIGFLVDGLPGLLTYIEHTCISDSQGQLAFEIIANGLRAIFAFLVSMMIIEFISGRNLSGD